MEHHTRRAIAYITGRITLQRQLSSVYDYSTSHHYHFSGTCDENNISIYDHDRSCHISGNITSFYHHGNSGHISLQINDGKFTGYDYNKNCHFSGSVNGNTVQVYDYSLSSYFNYTL